MESDRELILFWQQHKWTILLAIAGLIFAVSVITYGLFRTVFLFLCIAAGVWGGMKIDKKLAAKKRGGEGF